MKDRLLQEKDALSRDVEALKIERQEKETELNQKIALLQETVKITLVIRGLEIFVGRHCHSGESDIG